MGNPIRSKLSLTNFIYNQCCCCCVLRTGTLLIGILQLIASILSIVSVATTGGRAYVNLLTLILCLASGILILIGVHKNASENLWWSVYINLALCIWTLIAAIIFFIGLFWGSAVSLLIYIFLNFYFAMIIRSYAFELEESSTGVTNA